MGNPENISYLSNEDFVDYWSQFVRFYAKETGRDYSSKVPISFLTQKLIKEIIDRYELSVKSTNITTTSIRLMVRELIDKGAIEIESVRPKEKFTEKFKNPIQRLTSQLNLNPNFTLEFIEESPNEIYVNISIDVEDWFKTSVQDKDIALSTYGKVLRLFEKFLGIELGNPIYGQIRFINGGVDIKRADEWVKKIFVKQIKPKIKNSEYGGMIQRMQVEFGRTSFEIQIVSPRHQRRSNYNNSGLESIIKNIFSEMGYNPESVSVLFS